jgi:hypothetical protein
MENCYNFSGFPADSADAKNGREGFGSGIRFADSDDRRFPEFPENIYL